MPTHKDEWPNEHWEQLISTIIDRIGVERFLEMATYALEQHGCAWVALAAESLAGSETYQGSERKTIIGRAASRQTAEEAES